MITTLLESHKDTRHDNCPTWITQGYETWQLTYLNHRRIRDMTTALLASHKEMRHDNCSTWITQGHETWQLPSLYHTKKWDMTTALLESHKDMRHDNCPTWITHGYKTWRLPYFKLVQLIYLRIFRKYCELVVSNEFVKVIFEGIYGWQVFPAFLSILGWRRPTYPISLPESLWLRCAKNGLDRNFRYSHRKIICVSMDSGLIIFMQPALFYASWESGTLNPASPRILLTHVCLVK